MKLISAGNAPTSSAYPSMKSGFLIMATAPQSWHPFPSLHSPVSPALPGGLWTPWPPPVAKLGRAEFRPPRPHAAVSSLCFVQRAFPSSGSFLASLLVGVHRIVPKRGSEVVDRYVDNVREKTVIKADGATGMVQTYIHHEVLYSVAKSAPGVDWGPLRGQDTGLQQRGAMLHFSSHGSTSPAMTFVSLSLFVCKPGRSWPLTHSRRED